MSALVEIRGRAWVFGDHVDTDVIIPVRYCTSIHREELGPHAMAGLDPDFAAKVAPGDILVAGVNFGCGSSRETAPLALLGAGIGAVLAVSFGRIFFRNAVNVGLPIFESVEAVQACRAGDVLRIHPPEGRVRNERSGAEHCCSSYAEGPREVVASGGLVEYVKRRLARR